ncbi:alpha/beta fold hydrolase [Conexibacter arvalis]|uniref:Pimeloyl-ACP methyl ester carboxylesterase n=1 Tax=Conexibacter arvalis TaxID=912552 RepID=A0A840IB97_9ACTN|nr:pimeloyl-ACP methyl ester carboxylesterase [Conexibacter arvalis]
MAHDTATLEARSWAHWTTPAWATVDGLETAYRREGEGEPLLFLHGAGLTRMWQPLYARLAESFDTIVPEHPGFGDTAMPEWLDGIDDLVLHYDAFLDGLGVERVHLVGHSLGAWIAASLALTYPRRFASLTLMAPIGLRVPEAPPADPFRWSPEVALETLFSGVGERYAEYLEQAGEVEDTLHAYGESITFARLTWNPRYDVRLDRRLARVAAPTQVIGFADDRFVPAAHPRRWAELISGATHVELEGVGDEPASHLAVVQQPDRIAELIAAHAHRNALA